MKSNKGITLVALVITIIVLLILAGVSISLVVGDNGVLTQSQKASKATDLASAKSALELTLSSITSTFMGDVWSDDVNEKIYDNVTIADLDKELQVNGYYIVKFGGNAVKTAATDKIIDDPTDDKTQEASKEVEGYPYVTTTITISEGKPGQDAGKHKNPDKNSTYTATLKWSSTNVTIEKELELDKETVKVN